jgi:hypothetical protein
MTNLMCRGRKRGLAGIIATQRLAKLAKNVAAEASNFLMGRTFLDIDMARAADLLGMERRQAEAIRDLDRGHFLGLGPAISRRPVAVRIGAVKTSARTVIGGLMPLPVAQGEDMHALLHAEQEVVEQPVFRWPDSEPAPPAAEMLLETIESHDPDLPYEPSNPGALPFPAPDITAVVAEVLAEIVAEEGCTFQPPASLYQDFTVRCRMHRIAGHGIDLAMFRRRFAMALAGIMREDEPAFADLVHLARKVPDDVLAPFLMIARAAIDGEPCPDDNALARVYGTRSPGRIRRLLDHLEKSGLIVVRTDFGGRRSLGIPELGLSTAAV